MRFYKTLFIALLPLSLAFGESFEEVDFDDDYNFEEVFDDEITLAEEEFFEEELPFEESASAEITQTSAEPIEVEAKPSEMVSLPDHSDDVVFEDMALPPLDKANEAIIAVAPSLQIDLRQVFAGSPIIYTILFFLSVLSVCIWLYSMLTVRSIEFLPKKLIQDLRTKLVSNQFNEALDLCVKERHFFCKMLASGILARRHGLNMMVDTMKSEGKRSTISFWQRIGLLNEIAIIAPLLGLLGTVMGMFYAFYDLNRSIESVSLLFDGLGISVGTTVAGLIVAILAMILHSVAKYRLVRILASVENEVQVFAALIDTRSPSYLETSQ